MGGDCGGAPAGLPTGTVTMLFTDMEGSTRLLARLGDRYGEVLSAQRAVQRDAYRRHHGMELGTEGDSFFVVFSSAVDAVAACTDAQRGLAAYPWPPGAVPRIRMGLHTGEPTRHDDGYIGMDVHRAARIAATAHGGQVVLSGPTRQLASGRLAEEDTADLGWHRLKDITEPEHLYQLLIAGLPAQFPPLKSLGNRSSLPEPPTPLLAREAELRQLSGLLTGPGASRMVTLTGPGGVGKSRLALAAARSAARTFPDGVYFVPLAAVQETSVMWTSIAEALGVTGDGRSPPTFFEHIAGTRALLVLDNTEQLPGAGEVVAELLSAAAGVTVLATSRRPLRLPGEQEYPVLPLPVQPAAGPGGTWGGAVELFARHARMVRPSFTLTAANTADVVAICARLDGLPLALELAAARIRVLSPAALLARLGGSLEFEAGSAGRPERQRTLRDTIGWSYDLLNPGEQAFFRRMGTFSGGADLAAIAAVAPGPDALDAVAGLAEASLAFVRDGPDGEPRFGLLQTIAVFALERLAGAGELAEARNAHASFYADSAAAVVPELQGPRPLAARDRIEAELGNIRAALTWCLDPGTGPAAGPVTPQRAALGLRICQQMGWFWYAFGYTAEGRGWQRKAVAAASAEGGPELATALHGLAVLLLQQGETAEARDALETCLGIWRQAGDRGKIAAELGSLGVAHWTLGDTASGRVMLAESAAIAGEIGDEARQSTALGNLGVLEVNAGRPQLAIDYLERALAIDQRLGSAWGAAVTRANLAGAMLRAGRPQDAYDSLRATAAATAGLGDVELTIGLIELFACALAGLGHALRAARLLGTAQALREQAGMPMSAPDTELLSDLTGAAQASVSARAWDEQLLAGRGATPADALAYAVQD
jgi:predicted ATPase/class 3 adenylate cyclase